jgi:8-oxo-dGTP pyrophosphatase MutT (NUDIX family)
VIRRPPGLPDWWEPLLTRVADATSEDFTRIPLPEQGGRASAVLILLGQSETEPYGPDLLILQRAADMRSHAGQPAFPGGATDPEDDGDPVRTALREANEEVGLDPGTASVLTLLPPLYLPVSSFVVTPVLAWWHAPHKVYPREPAEVESVTRVPVAELADPANRVRVRHPSGYVGDAFTVRGMLVWGFTAGIVSALLDLAGWSRPWDPERVVPLPGPAAVPATPDGAGDEVIP